MADTLTARRWVYAIGGTAAIVGAILAGVGNLVHPVTPIDDPVGWLERSPRAISGFPFTS